MLQDIKSYAGERACTTGLVGLILMGLGRKVLLKTVFWALLHRFAPETRAWRMLMPWNDFLYSLRLFQRNFGFPAGYSYSALLAKLAFPTTNGHVIKNLPPDRLLSEMHVFLIRRPFVVGNAGWSEST